MPSRFFGYTGVFSAIAFSPEHVQPKDRLMASPAVDFARNNQQRFLNEPRSSAHSSVSTLDENKADVQKAADFVANDLRRIGMENVEVIPTKGHPLLYADWLHAPGKPTVLCYALRRTAPRSSRRVEDAAFRSHRAQ